LTKAALTAQSSAASPRHLGGSAGFVDEDKLLRIKAGLGCYPGDTCAAACQLAAVRWRGRFTGIPLWWKKRYTALQENRRPYSSSRWAATSASVMRGVSSISAKNHFGTGLDTLRAPDALCLGAIAVRAALGIAPLDARP